MLTTISRVPHIFTAVSFLFSLNLFNRIYRCFTPSLPSGDHFKTLKMAVQQQRLKQPDIEQERGYRSNLEQLPSEQARQLALVLNVCNHALQYLEALIEPVD
jgi:hypothetical protein